MPDTPAERARRYRERKAKRLPPVERVTCQACETLHTGARGVFCSRCWELCTPEGLAFKAERVARSRKRKREKSTSITTNHNA
jgi:hypothetical protein